MLVGWWLDVFLGRNAGVASAGRVRNSCASASRTLSGPSYFLSTFMLLKTKRLGPFFTPSALAKASFPGDEPTVAIKRLSVSGLMMVMDSRALRILRGMPPSSQRM